MASNVLAGPLAVHGTDVFYAQSFGSTPNTVFVYRRGLQGSNELMMILSNYEGTDFQFGWFGIIATDNRVVVFYRSGPGSYSAWSTDHSGGALASMGDFAEIFVFGGQPHVVGDELFFDAAGTAYAGPADGSAGESLPDAYWIAQVPERVFQPDAARGVRSMLLSRTGTVCPGGCLDAQDAGNLPFVNMRRILTGAGVFGVSIFGTSLMIDTGGSARDESYGDSDVSNSGLRLTDTPGEFDSRLRRAERDTSPAR